MAKTLNFTKQSLASLPAPKTGRDYFQDSKEKGLALYITSNGVITFFVRKRINGRDARIVLGRFPDLSVENARKQALTVKSEVAQGRDPGQEKRQLKGETTFGELFHEYMERYSKQHKRTWQYDEREIKKFLSHWFNRRISTITPSEMQKLHISIGKENGLYQANRLLERIRSMYNKAIEWGWKGDNPAVGVRKFKEKSRDRFLQPHEMPYFFAALEMEANNAAKDYITLSLLTGARKSNVLSMRWDQISVERAEWRIPETKNGEPMTVPLSPQALEILKERKKRAKGAWVFPSEASATGHLQDPKKAWKRLLMRARIYQLIDLVAAAEGWKERRIENTRRDAEIDFTTYLTAYQNMAKKLELDTSNIGLPDIRIHDLRRSLGSWQAVTGANSYVIGKSLGHKSQQATAIYARLNLDPVRESVERATDAMMLAAGRKK